MQEEDKLQQEELQSESNASKEESIEEETTDSSADSEEPKTPELQSKIINIERRSPANTVFTMDDSVFTPAQPYPSHWSIGWSDLMMTMFVLFFSMFIYKTANEEFLVDKEPEIIGGDTTEALQTLDSSGATYPFIPITPGLPIITGGTIKKVEKVPVGPPDASPEEDSQTSEPFAPPQEEQNSTKQEESPKEVTIQLQTSQDPIVTGIQADSYPPPSSEHPQVEPRPLLPEKAESPEDDSHFRSIYKLSKTALENNDLKDFAAIDIVPDKTVRIILTSDLLFGLGHATLSEMAKSSLKKITTIIKETPYMINIVGHTDNTPMRSDRYLSNWELSVARASSVVRFLIRDMGMNPNQFVISGYSSHRPIAPNTTVKNRAKNRRVEIIISKRLPKPMPATSNNVR